MSLIGYHVRLRSDQVEFLRSLNNASEWLRSQVDRGKAEAEAKTPAQIVMLLGERRAELLAAVEGIEQRPIYRDFLSYQKRREKASRDPHRTVHEDPEFEKSTTKKIIEAHEAEKRRLLEQVEAIEKEIDEIEI